MIRELVRRALNLRGWEVSGRRFPKPAQLRRVFRILTFREKLLVATALAAILTATSIVSVRAYLRRTTIVPGAGGSVTIGVIGRPLYLNPVLASSNPADEDLVRLLYAGLYRYDRSGALVPELAESLAIGDFGKTFEVKIKEGVRWPDGEPLTADDIAFTINTIKNPAIRSPLSATWSGIGVEVVDQQTIRFLLPAPYPPFPHNLTVGILPAHLWKTIPPESFSLSEQNLKPMGLGPFRAKSFERTRDGRIVSYTLERNDAAVRRALLDRVTFRFFDEKDDAIAAFNSREIAFLAVPTAADLPTLRSGAAITSAALPHIFALFFNQTTSPALADRNVRVALAHATNRDPIIEALGGATFATPIEQPIPPSMFGATSETEHYNFSPDEAARILEESGWKRNEDGTRSKKGETLTLTLTLRDEESAKRVGEIIRGEWRTIGVTVELRTLDAAAYRTAVSERDYQMLLAGQELPLDPDPFAFWHSSQRFDPGGNVALYNSKDADTVLEAARADFDERSRAEKYAAFQKILMADVPAIFLWQNRSVAAAEASIRGTETDFLANPSWRFGSVADWYVHTKRVWR